MADGTFQHGTDTMDTDELANRNGLPITGIKVQRVKMGHGIDGDLWDVTPAVPMPIGAGYLDVPLVAGQTTFTTAATGAAIDTLGFNWAAIQMSAGYTGMTSLTVQGSNDNVNWVTLALSTIGATSSGLTTSLGTTSQIWHGPIPCRYIRFVPVGTGSALVLTLTIRLLGAPLVLHSQGTNTNLSAVGSNILPAITNNPFTIGTATQNGFQERATSSADQAAASIRAAVSGQFMYVTGIHVSVYGAGATPRQIRVVAGASALIEQNLICPANDSVSRIFRNPWKTASVNNVSLNLAVTSIGAAAGTWDVVVEGYFQTS